MATFLLSSFVFVISCSAYMLGYSYGYDHHDKTFWDKLTRSDLVDKYFH